MMLRLMRAGLVRSHRAALPAVEGMLKEQRHDPQLGLLDVLVRAMDRIARLEADDPAPAAGREQAARLSRRMAELAEWRILRPVDDPDVAAQVDLAGSVNPRDTGMLLLGRPKD